MTRSILILASLLCFSLVAFGIERTDETPEERARRIRVAIAMSSPIEPPTVPTATPPTATPPAPEPKDYEACVRAIKTGKVVTLCHGTSYDCDFTTDPTEDRWKGVVKGVYTCYWSLKLKRPEMILAIPAEAIPEKVQPPAIQQYFKLQPTVVQTCPNCPN